MCGTLTRETKRMCDCPSCRQVGTPTTVPFVAYVLHRDACRWFWVTAVSQQGCEFHAVHTKNTKTSAACPKRFTTLHQVVRFFFPQISETEACKAMVEAAVHVGQPKHDRNLRRLLVSLGTCERTLPNTYALTDSKCHRFVRLPPPARRREEEEQPMPKRARSAQLPLLPKVSREGVTYDARLLGSHPRVEEVLRDFASWTEEVVEELFRYGALPPVGWTGEVFPHPFPKVEVRFVQPNGKLSSPTWFPVGTLQSCWPEAYRRLEFRQAR